MIQSRVIRKMQSSFFRFRLYINGLFQIPAQTRKEIYIFKNIFENNAKENKIKIFEWGSGYSTIYYAKYLLGLKTIFEWHSIDNNKLWHNKIKEIIRTKKLDKYVHLYLKEFPPFWEKPGWGKIPPNIGEFSPKSKNELEYINFPKATKAKFDIVIIDARFRRHCLRTAKDVLTPEGIVVMHDAQKPHYHNGIEDYRYSKFINSGIWYPFQENPNRMWIGSNKNNFIFRKISELKNN